MVHKAKKKKNVQLKAYGPIFWVFLQSFGNFGKEKTNICSYDHYWILQMKSFIWNSDITKIYG